MSATHKIVVDRKCTLQLYGQTHVAQVMVQCLTCWPAQRTSTASAAASIATSTSGAMTYPCICMWCAHHCHFGHQLQAAKVVTGFCDCGAERKCCASNPFDSEPGLMDSMKQLYQQADLARRHLSASQSASNASLGASASNASLVEAPSDASLIDWKAFVTAPTSSSHESISRCGDPLDPSASWFSANAADTSPAFAVTNNDPVETWKKWVDSYYQASVDKPVSSVSKTAVNGGAVNGGAVNGGMTVKRDPTTFDGEIWQAVMVRQTAPTSCVVSPLCIQSILHIARLASSNDARRALEASSACRNLNTVDWLQGLKTALAPLDVAVPFSLWCLHAVPLPIQLGEKFQAAGCRTVPFVHGPHVVPTVNALVRKMTATTTSLTQDLLQPSDIDAKTTTHLLLATIRLAARWKVPFPLVSTESQATFHSFHTASPSSVALMHRGLSSGNRYVETQDAQWLELDLFVHPKTSSVSASAWTPAIETSSGALVLGLCLPKHKEAAPGPFLLAIPDSKEFATDQTLQDIALPRFKLCSRGSVKSLLSQPPFSLACLFEPSPQAAKPNFAGFGAEHLNVFLHSIVHDASIEVEETGVTASAATCAMLGTFGISPTYPSFVANRSFSYYLRDPVRNLILFLGQMI